MKMPIQKQCLSLTNKIVINNSIDHYKSITINRVRKITSN